ncbi:hypothetical protein [Nocardioides sp.]|uniref:hypothetical protein n=1 Tax=Nocardioides sp. TaxID=35761 RepID=UPI0031FEB323
MTTARVFLVSLALASGACLAVATPASAAPDTNKCMSRSEYQAIHKGMPLSRVKSILNGQQPNAGGQYTSNYVVCWTTHSYAVIEHRVTSGGDKVVKSKSVLPYG